jgi:hypothetical protein
VVEPDLDGAVMADSPTKPRWNALQLVWAALLCAAIVAGHLYLADSAPFLDEGDHANTGRLLLAGKVMYRDAFNEKGPGLYWITAGLFSILGDEFVVVRRAASAGMLAAVLLLLALGHRVGKPTVGLSGATIFTAFHWLFLGAYWQSESVLTPAVLAVFLLLLTAEGDAKTPARFAAVGACLFIATSVKQTAWLLVLTLAVAFWLARDGGKRHVGARHWAAFVAGLGVPWALVLTVAAWQGATAEFLEGYLFPGLLFQVAPYLYGPSRAEFFLELPLWWMSLVTLGVAWQRRRDARHAWLAAVLLGTILMLSPALFAHHFLPVLAVAAFGFAWSVGESHAPWRRRLRSPAVVVFAALCLVAAWFAPRQYRDRVGVFTGREWQAIANEVKAVTAPTDSILAFPHDSTYYYLSERQPPGRYGFLLPWTTPPAVLERFAHEFDGRPPKVVLYTFLSNCTPTRILPPTYLGPFLEKLVAHYRLARIWPNRVAMLVPRDGASETREACRVRTLFYGNLPCHAGAAEWLEAEIARACP